MLLRQMFAAMRNVSLADPLLDSSASDEFRSQFDAALADQWAARGTGFGLAAAITRQLDSRKA